jgi:RNA polymerase sigma-70 factor (ECF subfamily)
MRWHGTPIRSCDDPAVREPADDDARLVRRLDEGDTDALRMLYDRYGGIVFGMTYRLLGDRQAAEECTQDVFVSVWRTARSYEPERARVSTWLLTIARNRAIDATRRRAARPVDPHEEVWATERSPDTADLVSEADEATRVAAAMAELSEPQREALSLAYFDGLSHTEIAERLGLPVGTVKGRIRLALDRLRAIAPDYALGPEAEA